MRISRDEWALRLAEVTALRGTCLRRRVGCVLLDADGVVLATGYNGVPRGAAHCNEIYDPLRKFTNSLMFRSSEVYPHACPGATAPTGTALDACGAIHAEMNALLFCSDVRRISDCYVTVSPCVACAKVLLNTGCRRIVFRERYASDAEALWTMTDPRAGRTWVHLPAT
jgi:dCMP deaminase